MALPVIAPPARAMPRLTPRAAAWKPACSEGPLSVSEKIFFSLK